MVGREKRIEGLHRYFHVGFKDIRDRGAKGRRFVRYIVRNISY